jgi:DNA-binding IclR family transcriptional regulator
MNQKSDEKKPPLSTLARGLEILEFAAKSDRLVRLRDVAEAFNIDRSAALRFLRTLQYMGYIERYEEFKAYAIGPKIYKLYRFQSHIEQVVDHIKPYLVRLGQETGQIAHLGVLDGNRAILVGVASASSRVTVKQTVGDMDSLYSSAVGKAIYAFLPEMERLRLGRTITFTKFTDNTITDLEGLEREATLVRENGIAFDDQEGSEEVSCIACPLFNKDNVVIASIGISLIAGLLKGPITKENKLIECVHTIAGDILNDGVTG